MQYLLLVAATPCFVRSGHTRRVGAQVVRVVQAKEKIQGRASEAGSCADAPVARQEDGRATEEGHAGSETAVGSPAKRLSLSALVTEVQKLTSALVKASSQAVAVCIPDFPMKAPLCVFAQQRLSHLFLQARLCCMWQCLTQFLPDEMASM